MNKIYIKMNKCFDINENSGEIEILFDNDFDYNMFTQIVKYEFNDGICSDDEKKYFFNKLYHYSEKKKIEVFIFGKKIQLNTFLTSNEVANILGISLQNLSYLRQKKLIPYFKMSERNYIYPIENILDFMVKYNKLHKTKKNIVANEKEQNKTDKTENTKISDINILDRFLYKKYVVRIPDNRYEKGEKFFLNFSYIFEGSGLILINDDGLVEDVYEHNIFTNSIEETIDVIENSKIQPFIEETGLDYKGFTKYYLSNIYKRLKKNNFADLRKKEWINV